MSITHHTGMTTTGPQVGVFFELFEYLTFLCYSPANVNPKLPKRRVETPVTGDDVELGWNVPSVSTNPTPPTIGAALGRSL